MIKAVLVLARTALPAFLYVLYDEILLMIATNSNDRRQADAEGFRFPV